MKVESRKFDEKQNFQEENFKKNFKQKILTLRRIELLKDFLITQNFKSNSFDFKKKLMKI